MLFYHTDLQFFKEWGATVLVFHVAPPVSRLALSQGKRLRKTALSGCTPLSAETVSSTGSHSKKSAVNLSQIIFLAYFASIVYTP